MVSVSDISDAYVLSILHPLVRTQVAHEMQTTGQSALDVLKNRIPATSIATNADELLEESGISLVKGANYHEVANIWLRSKTGSWSEFLTQAISQIGQHPERQYLAYQIPYVINPKPILPTPIRPTPIMPTHVYLPTPQCPPRDPYRTVKSLSDDICAR